MNLFNELKRRNVFRVGVAYAVACWLSLQIVDLVLENINAPDWIMQVFMLGLAVGFPIAIIVAWAFEMTPEGVKLQKNVDPSESINRHTGHQLNRGIIVILSMAIVLLLTDRYREELFGAPEPDDVKTENISNAANEPRPAESKQSIAVLPFVNMSSDPEQEYFSDGITEEILNRLAKVSELQVAARTSVFSFKGKNQDIRQIGEMLGVGNILEGSVRRDGEQVRITAQLIRTIDGFHLWSETYDRKLENIFAIQDDIASQIATALEISLGINNSGSAKPVDPKVYDLFLRARALHRNRGEGLIEAVSLFRQALEIDPDYAPAWAGLAHSYSVITFYISPQELANIGDPLELSRAATQQALSLDPELATALHAMANNLLDQHEWTQAQDYYERALLLDPDSTDIMEDYGNMLLYSLQVDKALKVMDRMIDLDPFVPLFQQVAAHMYTTAGDYEKRDESLRTLVSIDPEIVFTITWTLQRYFENRQFEEMHRYIDEVDLKHWTTADAMHRAIEWLRDPQQDPDKETLKTLSWIPTLTMLANRPDIFFDLISDPSDATRYTFTTEIYNPGLPADETRVVRELPQTKAFLKDVRLPEYWRKVGWPGICSPIGEDDFECH